MGEAVRASMSKHIVICVDFDGTIVEHAYPHIGEPLPMAFEVLQALKDAGYKLILWTCRENFGRRIDRQYLDAAVEFCRARGVEFDAVNQSIEDMDFRQGEDCPMRKPHAQLFIDDCNLGGFPGWEVVAQVLGLESVISQRSAAVAGRNSR